MNDLGCDAGSRPSASYSHRPSRLRETLDKKPAATAAVTTHAYYRKGVRKEINRPAYITVVRQNPAVPCSIKPVAAVSWVKSGEGSEERTTPLSPKIRL
jgi:hypothetical protein